MRGDIQNFVAACSVCAQAKVTQRPPQGLQLLPIPHRPWSHITLGFVTGLPTSNHNPTILTIIDRFSKAVHFIPLPKLPSASKTAQLLITHIVRLHGIPSNIVSDGGPQFSARFWKVFCTLIGTTVSLSSGFHPQTNGQTERANQAMETVLRCLCSNNPVSWSRQLPWEKYGINSHTSAAPKLSPFECQSGGGGGGPIGTGIRQEMQEDMKSHTRQSRQSIGPDEATCRQEEDSCPHISGRTVRVALHQRHPHQRGN